MVPRRYLRYAVSWIAECSTREASLVGHTTDLSRGGVFVATAVPLPVSSELEIVLMPPYPQDRIRVRGRVIWNSDALEGGTRSVPGMGIQFSEISRTESETLALYLAALPTAQGSQSNH